MSLYYDDDGLPTEATEFSFSDVSERLGETETTVEAIQEARLDGARRAIDALLETLICTEHLSRRDLSKAIFDIGHRAITLSYLMRHRSTADAFSSLRDLARRTGKNDGTLARTVQSMRLNGNLPPFEARNRRS